jgi:hypothetical protein
MDALLPCRTLDCHDLLRNFREGLANTVRELGVWIPCRSTEWTSSSIEESNHFQMIRITLYFNYSCYGD